MRMDWQLDGLIGTTPIRLMAAVKYRCLLATNGNTLDYLTYDFSLRQYDYLHISITFPQEVE